MGEQRTFEDKHYFEFRHLYQNQKASPKTLLTLQLRDLHGYHSSLSTCKASRDLYRGRHDPISLSNVHIFNRIAGNKPHELCKLVCLLCHVFGL
jgi:hypothetical protein